LAIRIGLVADEQASDSGKDPLKKLWFSFFLLGMSVGFYYPALSNMLNARGLGTEWIERVFMVGPLAALISPLIVGAMADYRYAAQKIYGWICLISSIFHVAAFWMLQSGRSPWLFLVLMAIGSVISAPMWGMMTSISMSHLKQGERHFPIVRMGGTVGWIVAGVVLSYILKGDRSVVCGYAGALARIVGGICAFWLPHTRPQGGAASWKDLLGLGAFKLLKERDQRVFFLISALVSVPLAAFFPYTPKHLLDLGDARPVATMALGQVSEVLAMVGVTYILTRMRVKSLLMIALLITVSRFAAYTLAGWTHWMPAMWYGILFHGAGYTFYFITGQIFLDRRIPPAMRSQAQGLLALLSSGLGTLVGNTFCRHLYDFAVSANHGGWAFYWGVLTALALICVPILGLGYKGLKDQAPS
jgi:Nucleoside H+ symporter